MQLLKSKKLDPKLKATMKYFNMVETEIQNISKKLLVDEKMNITEEQYHLLADYALASIHKEWETLRNRGYSLLHKACWEYWYGDQKEVIDPYGYPIQKDNFGFQDGQWNVDHIWPYSKGGLTVIENGIPTSYQANEIKKNLTEGIINKNSFNVEKNETIQGPIGKLFINNKEFKPSTS